MTYIIPPLQALLDGIDEVRGEYLRNRQPPNPDRVKLIDTLEAVRETLKQLAESDEPPAESEIQEAMLGAYIFALEHINATYRLLKPEYSKGYVFDSGSKLYKALLEKLGINGANNLDDKSRLIYLSKFYNLVFKANKQDFREKSTEKNLEYKTVKTQVEDTLRSTFNHVVTEANKLIRAIPTEQSIDTKMQAMPDKYQENAKSDNPDRLLLARLIKAMSEMLPQKRGKDEQHFLSRTQRIKMGLLLYVMQSIWDTYWVRSPEENSVLYDLCKDALNIQKIEDIDQHTRQACLSAFETFLMDSRNIEKLETALGSDGAKIYIDPKVHVMRGDTVKMVEKLCNTQSSRKISYVAIGMAVTGAVIAASPGYGAGYAIGYALSQTNESVNPKLIVSKLTGRAMTLVLGDAGNYLGYFAADMVINASLERAFAKVFEGLSMMVGALTGGVIGLVIYDLSYKTLRDLCSLYMNLHAKLDPTLAKDFDPQFVQCLLNLPPEIFTDEQKSKIQTITQGRLFSHPVAARSDDAAAELHLVSSSDARADSQVLSLSRSV
ncbi:hypothetical protein AQUSIP_23480 [Aquicella siphonis]|uniref:Uncharacterized protein n=1 Tax=Aquicella siphonis TaxID=254247 RepID=A0A5E4PKS1_9COXI|nr:hypothetical protein [Aquicella siphonis]VVC77021.1 hypothetical protein AQUSIP_23480 [Aquicella siphonis]